MTKEYGISHVDHKLRMLFFFSDYYLEDCIQMLNFKPPIPDKKKKREKDEDDDPDNIEASSFIGNF